MIVQCKLDEDLEEFGIEKGKFYDAEYNRTSRGIIVFDEKGQPLKFMLSRFNLIEDLV